MLCFYKDDSFLIPKMLKSNQTGLSLYRNRWNIEERAELRHFWCMHIIKKFFFKRWALFLSRMCLKLIEITSYTTKCPKLVEERVESNYSYIANVTKCYVFARKIIFSFRKCFKVIRKEYHSIEIDETLRNERNRDTCYVRMS